MRPMVSDDVAFTFAQVGQTAQAAVTLYPDSAVAEEIARKATGLLQLWDVMECEAAVEEVLAEIDAIATKAAGALRPAKVWTLLARKVEVAKAFLKTYCEQQAAAKTPKPGIDEAGDA